MKWLMVVVPLLAACFVDGEPFEPNVCPEIVVYMTLTDSLVLDSIGAGAAKDCVDK